MSDHQFHLEMMTAQEFRSRYLQQTPPTDGPSAATSSPHEPTDRMLIAGLEVMDKLADPLSVNALRRIWRAMAEAA
jgi:DNA-binding MurR/RpiR family transcriptional regulator